MNGIYPTGLLDINPADLPQQQQYQPLQMAPMQQAPQSMFGGFNFGSPEAFTQSLIQNPQQANMLSALPQLYQAGLTPGQGQWDGALNYATTYGGLPWWAQDQYG